MLPQYDKVATTQRYHLEVKLGQLGWRFQAAL